MTFKKSQVTALYGEFQTADAKLDHLYSNGGTDTEIEATYAHIMRSASALCDAKPETYKEVALQLRFVLEYFHDVDETAFAGADRRAIEAILSGVEALTPCANQNGLLL
ncbi:MAG: hypothetical protein AAF367_07515 [Pseudomonadota bacterium]